MIKIEKQLEAGQYTALFLSAPIPLKHFNKLVIDKKEYDPVITYDLPQCIAIKEKGNFAGKEVLFV